MIDISQLFKDRKKKISALKAYGFKLKGGKYYYAESILEGQFEVRVTVSDDVKVEVYDMFAECNYYLHTVKEACGGFVGEVRGEYERILSDISSKCFDKAMPYREDAAKYVFAYAKQTYGGKPEFLWKDDDTSCIIRRKDNKKWYALFMQIERKKLGIDGDGLIEILDLRAPKEEIPKLVDKKNYFGGWHMNKKTWITVPLDGRVPAEVICSLLDLSFTLAK
jgi:predicted DNA-binding protein (MmcQ/YjbR family)